MPSWPRLPWRSLLGLTMLVALLHLLLLGWLPMGGEPEALPLAQRFSTRTIVIAPPAATGGGAPAAAPAARAAPPASAAPTARLRDKPRPAPPPPRPAVPSPEPAPAPQEAPPPEPVLPPPTPVAEAPMPEAAEPAAPPPAEPAGPPEPAPAAPAAPAEGGQGQAAAPASGQGRGEGAGTGAGAGAGTPGAREPLKVPGSVRLDFAVTGQQGMQPMSGVFGELIWLQDGSSYNARLALRVLFRTIRTQTSVGALSAAGIEPRRFSDARRSEVATHFVRESGQIVFSSTTTPAPLMPGAQDRLSVILQLAALMAGDPDRHPPGSSFSIQTAGARDAETWRFSVEGEEQLETPAGSYLTRRLVRLPRKDYDQKIELWLAPELGWLPVRIRQTQANGDFADMQLRAFAPP
ncbi:DUF3108 domain-containing protein [Xenophilus arseniciresistens]|uniref:DUF3108 domain-containing protein n=1 Tax=Xenophilus arseniciresistens TaxID=1283306 RepID=A0AAE3T1S2_9BURK|nr:DUF3108 domain-containing protein [Xenophilus arseniciresistens]MDA7418910.1 DUF3108 domain-containing protein [Xenophilus arseniciresistens]